jgi:hypothetical protein
VGERKQEGDPGTAVRSLRFWALCRWLAPPQATHTCSTLGSFITSGSILNGPAPMAASISIVSQDSVENRRSQAAAPVKAQLSTVPVESQCSHACSHTN